MSLHITTHLKNGGKNTVNSYQLIKNTVGDLPCYHCNFTIHKNYTFYSMAIYSKIIVKVALCFNCFNLWKRGKFII